MKYSIRGRAEFVGTCRWIEIQFMEMLATWLPTTPEMEVKILFGRHVWDCAQHADALGRRAFELRAPLHFTLPAVAPYQSYLTEIGALVETPQRVCAFYDAICPAMARRYRGYCDQTDPLMDEPTVRIIERILLDHGRMAQERCRLAGQPSGIAQSTQLKEWIVREEGMSGIVAHRQDGLRARPELV